MVKIVSSGTNVNIENDSGEILISIPKSDLEIGIRFVITRQPSAGRMVEVCFSVCNWQLTIAQEQYTTMVLLSRNYLVKTYILSVEEVLTATNK